MGGTAGAGVGRERTKTNPREVGRLGGGASSSLSLGNLLTKYKFKDITKEFKDRERRAVSPEVGTLLNEQISMRTCRLWGHEASLCRATQFPY